MSQIEMFRAQLRTYEETHNNINEILANVHTAWFEDGNSFEVKVRVKSEIAHFFELKKYLPSQENLQRAKMVRL